jgi:hypothetical protein
MIDLLSVEEPKPEPANSYDTARHRSTSCSNACGRLFGPIPNKRDQYSQGPGTQRKTSPSTATWQTDGNDK